MNTVLWLLAGASLGWITFSALNWNENRGLLIALVLGGSGGILGGKLVAPMFLATAAVPADFRFSALLFAAAVAVAVLAIANLVLNRWEI